MPDLNNAAYWRERASESRAVADGMKDPVAKQTMLNIAAGYDHLAEHAERREQEAEAGKDSHSN
jgi:hypothetical protein